MQAELQASTVDLLQNVLRALVAQGGVEPPEFRRVPRPYEPEIEPEPEQTVGLAQFADILKGP